MADLVAIADGNFTAAATWGLVDTTSKLVSTNTGVTALTTGNLDSAAFTPGAITVIGVAVKLGARASGSPTNTITIILRNSTGGIDVASVTANVSDLPACTSGADTEGGWHFFKFNAPVLLLAATNYVVRATLSSTSTAVSLCTNGTANNWQRLLVTSTTQAPAAGDDMYAAQTLDGSTNPATVTARAITMDSTAATDYGTANTSTYVAALYVSKACTISYGVAASTNYVLRLSGQLLIASGGTFNIGTSGAEVPRNSTAVLEFDNAADSQFGTRVLNGAIFRAYGLSRTVAKDIWYCKLSADHAIGATTINVDTDTGWLNGDEVAIASTTRTATETEVRSLNADAGASSFTIGVGLTNAHLGSGDYFAEVALLTRNVEIRSVTVGFMTFTDFYPSSTVFCQWARFRSYSGAAHTFRIFTTSAGSLTLRYCVFRDGEQTINTSGGTNDNWTIDKCILYSSTSNGFVFAVTSGTAWVATDLMVFFTTYAINISDIGGTIGNLWAISCDGGFQWNQAGRLNDGTEGPTFPVNSVWTVHSCAGGSGFCALQIPFAVADITFPTFKFWRNNSYPIQVGAGASLTNVEINGDFFGNGLANVAGFLHMIGDVNIFGDVRFVNCNISGDTLFQAVQGFLAAGNNIVASKVLWRNCKFSENTGTRRPFSAVDIDVSPSSNTGGTLFQGIADDCSFGATTPIRFYNAGATNPKISSKYSYIACPRYGQVNNVHRTYTPYGTIILDTTTFDVTPSQNIKPIGGAALAVDSNAFRQNTGFCVPVNNGATVTVSVKVQIDASYNGSTNPQLVLLANRAIGINADVVLDTHSGVPGSFETLTGVTAAAGADGVMEFIVRCYGTAGNAWVDTWSATAQNSSGVRYWENGQPVTIGQTGGAAGGETAAAYVG